MGTRATMGADIAALDLTPQAPKDFDGYLNRIRPDAPGPSGAQKAEQMIEHAREAARAAGQKPVK